MGRRPVALLALFMLVFSTVAASPLTEVASPRPDVPAQSEPEAWGDWVPPTWDDTVAIVGPLEPPPEAADPGEATVTPPAPDGFIETERYGLVPAHQLIVVLEPGLEREVASAIADQLGAAIVGEIEFAAAYQLETDATTEAGLEAALATARAIEGVLFATPNQGIVAHGDEGEIWGVRLSPLEDGAYAGDGDDGYDLIGVGTAWNYIRASGMELHPTQVGVIDSGLYEGTGEFDGGAKVTYTDPDAKLAAAETIEYSDGSRGTDPSGGHGTSVNTLIAGDADDGGPAGIASVLGGKLTLSNTNLWGTKYSANPKPTTADPSDPTIQTYGAHGPTAFADLAAIMAQVKAGSKVINLSWGNESATADKDLVKVYRAFFKQLSTEHPDVLFVAAAGNEGKAVDGELSYPGGFALPNIITVGNTDNDAGVAASSTTAGKDFEMTIHAPGEGAVRGKDRSSGQVTKTYGGTSMAAPQVAATAALLKSLNPDLSAGQIKKIITTTARKKGDTTVLAVDEAVRFVIDLNRDLAGKPRIPIEELRQGGVVDAVALPLVNAPGEYLVRGIVGAVGEGGADVTISVDGGKVVEGATPRHLDAPAQVGWMVKLKKPNLGTMTVRRGDNGAGSRITIEPIDINGRFSGTLTITDFDIDEKELAKAFEGCEVEEGSVEKIKEAPFPIIMRFKVNKKGRGTVNFKLDPSLLEPGEKPQVETLKVIYKGNIVSIDSGNPGGTKGSMRGIVKMQGDRRVITGSLTQKGNGIRIKAVWSVSG